MRNSSRLLAVVRGLHSLPRLIRHVMLTVVLLACSGALQSLVAQTSGRIAGAVKDATGAVIPNSHVVLVNPANGVKQNFTTGIDGVFTFAVVPVGEYELDVKADGFNLYRQTANLRIDVNTALTFNVVLQVADASQAISVTENTAEVHTTDTQMGQTRKQAGGRYPSQWPHLHRPVSRTGRRVPVDYQRRG